MLFDTFSMIHRDQESADRTREILKLGPDVEWSELDVEFGLDKFGTVTLTLFVTGEQVIELAKLALQQVESTDCASVVEQITENCPPLTDEDAEAITPLYNAERQCNLLVGHSPHEYVYEDRLYFCPGVP